MISTVKDTIINNKMIDRGDKVFAAVSGGADSVCLLIVLKYIKDELGFDLEAIHVEHGIRGEESIEDARFVEKLCDSMNIKIHMHSVKATEYAKKNSMSLEEAARELRYNIFEGYEGKIAIAHNMEDNAETLIFNMVRGSGIEGLTGIGIKRGKYIRPLLACSRTDIEKYLSDNNQPYRTDSTNEDSTYTRNNIRHNIIPKLRELNPKAIEHISELTDMQRRAVDYINSQADKAYHKYVSDNRLSRNILNEELIIVQSVAYKYLCEFAGSKKDIAATHVEQVLDMLNGTAGRQTHLPYNMIVRADYDYIELHSKGETREAPESINKILNLHKVGDKEIIEWQDVWLKLELKPKESETEIEPKNYTKVLDYDKIIDGVCVRNRQREDYIVINSKGSKKSISRYMIDEKIPSHIRDKELLICDGHHVMYVVGHRISEAYKVDDETKVVLRIDVDIIS